LTYGALELWCVIISRQQLYSFLFTHQNKGYVLLQFGIYDSILCMYCVSKSFF